MWYCHKDKHVTQWNRIKIPDINPYLQSVDFYKHAIAADNGEPKSSLPYYYLIDNLLADNRADEAEQYLKLFAKLPSANPVMVDIYKAYVALARYDVSHADEIISECVKDHANDFGYLFEAAQYYVKRCDYTKALELYERSWAAGESPRFTDSLQGIAKVCKIMGNKEGAISAYERILDCLKNEWGYANDDKPCADIYRMISNI